MYEEQMNSGLKFCKSLSFECEESLCKRFKHHWDYVTKLSGVS